MGLIKAFTGAVGGVFADQWKEYFYCNSIDASLLMVKGQKRQSRRSVNRKGEDNIISNGSKIAVADGQAMAIVEQGKVVEFSAESGEFIWDASSEPSIFNGKFGDSLKNTFSNIGKRFTFGAQAPKDQRIYYFNLKEIVGNKYGTQQPVPFRVVDKNIGLDVDISVRCNGEYSYKLSDPILFYTNVCGNVIDYFSRDKIDGMLKTELLTELQAAFARISKMGIRYSALPGHTAEIADILKELLFKKWTELRGITISSFGINTVSASPADENMLKELQRTAVLRNPGMAGAAIVGAQADAMRTAAGNSGGAMIGFLGLNAAINAASNAGQFYNMESLRQPQTAEASSWKCSCGTDNTGKFCQECGRSKNDIGKA